MAARTIPGYAQVAIIAYTGPANGDATRKPSRDNYYQSDHYYRHALAQKLMKELGQAQPGTMYLLDKLPAGLTAWENQRPVLEGRRNSGTTDRFIYGHPGGPFETLDRAYDHIKFLLLHGAPSPTNPCPCHRCGKKRTKVETGVVRTCTPVPCPLVQITSVQVIPDHLRRLKLVDLIKALNNGDHLTAVVQQPQQVQQVPQVDQAQSTPMSQLFHQLYDTQQAQLTQQPRDFDLMQARRHQYTQQLWLLSQLRHHWQNGSTQQAKQRIQTRQTPWMRQAPYSLQVPSTPVAMPHPEVFYNQTVSSFTYQMQQQSVDWNREMVYPQLTAPSAQHAPSAQQVAASTSRTPQVPTRTTAFIHGLPDNIPWSPHSPIKREYSTEPGPAAPPSFRQPSQALGTKRNFEEQHGEEEDEATLIKRAKPDPAVDSATSGIEQCPSFSRKS
ncbi:hypothetical protein DOTSEDRAFT_24083 [Dothistroma septosporum NZE10]|uniref:Cryptic loci regulator 2 N-terminal domain-containing protein n=1 Tax=Dothistroma septosporum (strain NZE10 / CBS 128990) TaxID=675120 RepID=N1PNI1_DOTSN|nr:hypothetical protein DOTSEDRAFT_24083 [Dothistroma septosporum NZE10]